MTLLYVLLLNLQIEIDASNNLGQYFFVKFKNLTFIKILARQNFMLRLWYHPLNRRLFLYTCMYVTLMH